MDTYALESLLAGATETPRIEYKASAPWSTDLYAKDILALTNTDDGGYIIVGVEDKTLARTGVSAEHAQTYVSDLMRDAMSRFADPYVQFSTHKIVGADGLTYVAIRVEAFDDVPVICRIDNVPAGVDKGRLYIRTKTRRPESALISTHSEMRELIERASVRMMQRYHRLGLRPRDEIQQDSDAEALQKELGDL